MDQQTTGRIWDSDAQYKGDLVSPAELLENFVRLVKLSSLKLLIWNNKIVKVYQ